ncbi:Rne/Rng family ribonuclease [bacterium]|nr:Rne/Rng family ribonuclease [bacterium]
MKKILINEEPWQTRIAIVEDGKLQNIYFWSHVGNTIERCFFKALVTKVLPGIQTAFVDIGQEKSGFLHISEIDRELAINKISENLGQLESTSKKEQNRAHHQPLDIGKILKEGESLLVQVTKEPINEKGAKLTTCFALPGRFIVLMPSIPRIGISKKIEAPEERDRLKELVLANIPEGMGAIIRTTTEHRTEREVKQDIKFLLNIWNGILEKEKTAKVGEIIYQDVHLAFQVIRDHLDETVEQVIIDDKSRQKELAAYVQEIAPEHSAKICLYNGREQLFDRYNVEEQIRECLNKKVDLASGGSIIIEETEAMTVVDVNTGRYIGKTNLEDTILKTNLEAAKEVARQLKIRNVGGLIVIDFIDMFSSANKQKLFKCFEKELKEQDKFQSVLLKISEFGLVQMTRKRSGKTLGRQLTDTCSHCTGTGTVPSVQAQGYKVLRSIKQELATGKISGSIIVKLNQAIFDYISTVEYKTLFDFEKLFNCKITLETDKTVSVAHFKVIEAAQ